MIKTIFEKVVEVMETLKGVGQPLADVYGYPEPSPQLFPCAIMDISGGLTQEDTSSMSKWLTVNVVVRVMIRQRNAQEATLLRLDVMDKVIEAFTTEDIVDDLGGVCDLLDIPTIEPLFVAGSSDQPLFGFDIVISAKKIMRAT